MSSKKEELLKKAAPAGTTSFDLNETEILEIASLQALVEQAEAARNFMYSRIVGRIAQRNNIEEGKDIDLNWAEIMAEGAKVAKLIVKD